MTAKISGKAKKMILWALVAISLGVGASASYAKPRQCRVQNCWDLVIITYCYYDSGWQDC